MARRKDKSNRYILKVSGELFSKEGEHVSFSRYDQVAQQIIKIVKVTGIQLAMVVGGGNIFRGSERASYIDSSEADSMGMLSTVINGIALREALVRNGAKQTRLMTAFSLPEFAEPYIRLKAKHHLDENRIIVLAGGLGLPGFSTDSAVAQYAHELECDLVLKASTVNGVYDSDPKKNNSARKIDKLTYRQALQQELKVMDSTAFAVCGKSEIPMFIFDIKDLNMLPEILEGNYSFGSLITK